MLFISHDNGLELSQLLSFPSLALVFGSDWKKKNVATSKTIVAACRTCIILDNLLLSGVMTKVDKASEDSTRSWFSKVQKWFESLLNLDKLEINLWNEKKFTETGPNVKVGRVFVPENVTNLLHFPIYFLTLSMPHRPQSLHEIFTSATDDNANVFLRFVPSLSISHSSQLIESLL